MRLSNTNWLRRIYIEKRRGVPRSRQKLQASTHVPYPAVRLTNQVRHNNSIIIVSHTAQQMRGSGVGVHQAGGLKIMYSALITTQNVGAKALLRSKWHLRSPKPSTCRAYFVSRTSYLVSLRHSLDIRAEHAIDSGERARKDM